MSYKYSTIRTEKKIAKITRVDVQSVLCIFSIRIYPALVMKGLNQISIDSLHEDVCPNADKRIVTEKIVNARQRENEREEEGDEGNSRQRRGEKKKKKKEKRKGTR